MRGTLRPKNVALPVPVTEVPLRKRKKSSAGHTHSWEGIRQNVGNMHLLMDHDGVTR